MPVQTIIKLRRDTAANWLSTNPILASGEQGYETNTGLSKIGDGTTAWDALPYVAVSRITEEVKNSTGATIAKGSVVYISGANGDNALISLADADTETTSSKTLGLVAADIADGATGMVVCEGLISGLNTGSATAGQSVWLSSTAGGFVFNAPPAKPAHSVYLGVVVRAHSVNGEILVKVQNGYELNELHDVNAGSPSDNNLLAWDSATSMWTNQTAAQAGLAAVSHTHAQSDITNLSTDLAAKASLSGATFTGVVKGMIPEEIGGSVNLDTYTTTGIYHQQANAQAASGTNYPVAEAGMLTVTTGASGNFIYQTYQAFGAGNNRIYWRGKYMGSWSAWRQLRDITISTGDPSGGVNGDVWLKYTP